MSDTAIDPKQLADLTDDQVTAMVRLIKSGKLDFEVYSTDPGHYSHDISISVDHEELMAAIGSENSN